MNERTSQWLSTSVNIFGCSGPQCSCEKNIPSKLSCCRSFSGTATSGAGVLVVSGVPGALMAAAVVLGALEAVEVMEEVDETLAVAASCNMGIGERDEFVTYPKQINH